MATKARFYRVTTQNGHGESTKIVSAPKKSVIPSVFENKDIKVSKVKHLGFMVVNAVPNEDMDDVIFVVPNLSISIEREEAGYKSLSVQFDDKVADVDKQIKDYHSGGDFYET